MTALGPEDLEALEKGLHGVQSFARQGQLTAVGTAGRQIRLYSGRDLLWQTDLRSHDARVRPMERVRSIAFSNAGDQVYIACGDSLKCLDAATGRELWRHVPPRMLGFIIASPYGVCVTENDEVVVSFDSARWAVLDRSGKVKRSFRDNDSPRLFEVVQGRMIGAEGMRVGQWDIESGVKVTGKVFSERIHAFSASPDGRSAVRLLHRIIFLDAHLRCQGEMPAPVGTPVMRLSPDGERIACAHRNEVGIYDLKGTLLETVPFPTRVIGLSWSNSELLIGGLDGTWQAWAG